MPKIINILLSVIDNFGDMGFALELLSGFERSCPRKYNFHIWTDKKDTVEYLFKINKDILPLYKIYSNELWEKREGEVTLLLFHHPIPEERKNGSKQELFLRIDYLSFDPLWVKYSGQEHILSNSRRQIRELIPSPLSSGAGLIFPERDAIISREEIAIRYGLDPSKQWISLFMYADSLEHLSLDSINGYKIIMFGEGHIPEKHNHISYLPFLPLREFQSIIRESSWTIIRGEVSFISTLQIGTPFFWNMYHEKGGFPTEQARDFLEWKEADEVYRDIFYRLNGQKEGVVSLSEITHYFQTHSSKDQIGEKDIVREIEKYIDSFYFSL